MGSLGEDNPDDLGISEIQDEEQPIQNTSRRRRKRQRNRLRREDVQDVGEFPHVTSFTGDLINFVLPIVDTVKCHVPGCGQEYSAEVWYSAKQSIIRHIEYVHQNPINKVQRWCSTCQISIPTRVSYHYCFETEPFIIETENKKYTCRRCEFTCPSRRGLLAILGYTPPLPEGNAA